MLVLKKLFSGNYLKKLHIIENISIQKSSDINKESKEIKNNKEDEDKKLNNNFYLISVYESSLSINECEYNSIIKQYIQTPIYHHKLFFIIFDSEVITDKIILLTSIGLFVYKFEKTKLNIIYSDIFNIKCEAKDLLMYLKYNKELNIIVIYSNTNLFFLYHFDSINNSVTKVNQINRLCNGYIKNINMLDIKDNDNNNRKRYFIFDIQREIRNRFNTDIYLYQINQEKDQKIEINEIDQNNLKDENSTESMIKQNINFIYDLYSIINSNYNEEKIFDIRYLLNSKYIFVINETGYIILKRKKTENNENSIDLLMKFKFKHFNSKKSFFIDYKIFKNFHFLFFDNKIILFEEKEEILSRIKFIPKENKKYLQNSYSIFRNNNSNNNNNEISIILSNYKNDISFINLTKDVPKEKEINDINNKYKINIITRITNESMFCLDAAIIKHKYKDDYKIIAICGLQGESRLIKYSNIFDEINLYNHLIDSQILSMDFITNNFSNKYFHNLFITSNEFKSNLYSLNTSFQIRHIKEFASPASKIYKMKNNDNAYIILLKSGIGMIEFNDKSDCENYKLKNIYECQSNIYILFSYYFIYDNMNFLVIYLNNRKMICFNINSSSILFDQELSNLPQPSSLGVIAIESLKKIGLIFGNYIKNNIMTIYYNIETNSFEKDISETNIKGSLGNVLLTPVDILIYNYYIFITTNTGDFIVLYFNENDLKNPINKILFNLENITKNESSLKFSQIDYSDEKKEFNIDLFNFKNSYNIILNIKQENEELSWNNKLIKYKFNSDINLPLFSFQKIYSDSNNITIHYYFSKNSINFSNFPKNNNNLSIETIFKFKQDEKAVKIISILIKEQINAYLVLTNNSSIYLFSPDLNTILSKNIKEESNKLDLKISGIKNYIIKEDDNNEETYINLIIAFGGFKLSENNNQRSGILLIYEFKYNDNDETAELKPIKIISGFPQSIIDACLIKNYIICSIESALCVKKYSIKNNEIIWNKDEVSKIFYNYMNKVTNLVPLNKFCSNYYLLTCDIYESFQLIKFNGISVEKYETLGADLSLNSLANLYPLNNNANEVLASNKEGIIYKFGLKDELYTINNEIDLKEYITKINCEDNKVVMLGLLGSIYYGEIIDKNDKFKEFESDLLKFQKDVFNEVCKINLKKNIKYEDAMLMDKKIKNVLLIDILLNFCENYYNELNNKIYEFEKYVNALKAINNGLLLKIE